MYAPRIGDDVLDDWVIIKSRNIVFDLQKYAQKNIAHLFDGLAVRR